MKDRSSVFCSLSAQIAESFRGNFASGAPKTAARKKVGNFLLTHKASAMHLVVSQKEVGCCY